MRKQTKNKFIATRISEYDYKKISKAIEITKQSMSDFLTASAVKEADKIIKRG